MVSGRHYSTVDFTLGGHVVQLGTALSPRRCKQEPRWGALLHRTSSQKAVWRPLWTGTCQWGPAGSNVIPYEGVIVCPKNNLSNWWMAQCQEHVLVLLRAWVWLSATTLGSSQLPVTLTQGDLVPSFRLLGLLNSLVHIPTHIHIFKNKTKFKNILREYRVSQYSKCPSENSNLFITCHPKNQENYSLNVKRQYMPPPRWSQC